MGLDAHASEGKAGCRIGFHDRCVSPSILSRPKGSRLMIQSSPQFVPIFEIVFFAQTDLCVASLAAYALRLMPVQL
jgi:hypothetical protein